MHPYAARLRALGVDAPAVPWGVESGAGGVVSIAPALVPAIVAVMQQTGAYYPHGGAVTADPEMGSWWNETNHPESWIDDRAEDRMVMLDASGFVPNKPIEVAVSADPFVIAHLAGQGGGYALLKGPAALADQARQAALEPPPSPPPTTGSASGLPDWAAPAAAITVMSIGVLAVFRSPS